MDFDYQKVGAGYYDKIFEKLGGLRRFWHEVKFRQISDWIEPGPSTRILDVGCAAGSFLGRMAEPFGQAVGMDISPIQVEYARSKYGRGNLQFISGDAKAHFIFEEPFDYIVLSEVIEHFSYSEGLRLLERIRQNLKPRGRLILTTPNYRSLWPVLEFFVNRFLPVGYEHQHVNKLDWNKTLRMLTEAGFRIEQAKTVFFLGQFGSLVSYPFSRWWCRLESRLFPRLGAMMMVLAAPSNP